MPLHPKEPHLFTVNVDGEISAAVRAMSNAEARDYWLVKHVVIERPTPIQAFRVGSLLAVEIENAKPEYGEPSPQEELALDGRQDGGEVDA